MSETKINDLIDSIDNNNEDTMVDSIINELNNSNGKKSPQMSQQEKNMLMHQQKMKQQQMAYQQQMAQQQIAQQQMAQQQMAHQQQMAQQQMAQQQMTQQMAQQKATPQQSKFKNEKKNKNEKDEVNEEDTGNKLKDYVLKCKDAIIVLVLVTLFEMDVFKEILKFKGSSFLYDIQNEKSKFLSYILRGLIIALFFGTIQYFVK
tara:strand:+ start:1210 stop:1821 length:612 start_codon:yes stop_codon:yes gene_type:complete